MWSLVGATDLRRISHEQKKTANFVYGGLKKWLNEILQYDWLVPYMKMMNWTI